MVKDVPLFGKDMSQAIMGRRLVRLDPADSTVLEDDAILSSLTAKSDRADMACSKSWSESENRTADDAVIMAATDAHRAASAMACPRDSDAFAARSFNGNEGDNGHCRRRNGDTNEYGDRGQDLRGDCEPDLNREGESGLFMVSSTQSLFSIEEILLYARTEKWKRSF